MLNQILISAGVGLVGLLLWLWEKAGHADALKNLAIEQARHKQTASERQAFMTENIRLATSLNFLRAETMRLNDEVSSCSLPGHARERLNRMLARASGDRSF